MVFKAAFSNILCCHFQTALLLVTDVAVTQLKLGKILVV